MYNNDRVTRVFVYILGGPLMEGFIFCCSDFSSLLYFSALDVPAHLSDPTPKVGLRQMFGPKLKSGTYLLLRVAVSKSLAEVVYIPSDIMTGFSPKFYRRSTAHGAFDPTHLYATVVSNCTNLSEI